MSGTGSATGDATGDDSAAAGVGAPQGRRSRISLRARIAWLVAVCVAVAVALAAVAVYVTARSELYSRFDADLIARAQAAVGGALADPNQLVQVPADAFGGAQYALVTSRGLVFSPRGGATPPVGDAELAVATGASGQSIRAVQQNGQALRVVAVPAGGKTKKPEK